MTKTQGSRGRSWIRCRGRMTPALTPPLSPEERESPPRVFSSSNARPANAALDDIEAGECFSLSPGERAGVRAVVTPFFPALVLVTYRKQRGT